MIFNVISTNDPLFTFRGNDKDELLGGRYFGKL